VSITGPEEIVYDYSTQACDAIDNAGRHSECLP